MLGHPGPLAKSNLHQHMQLLVWVPACQNRSNTKRRCLYSAHFYSSGKGSCIQVCPPRIDSALHPCGWRRNVHQQWVHGVEYSVSFCKWGQCLGCKVSCLYHTPRIHAGSRRQRCSKPSSGWNCVVEPESSYSWGMAVRGPKRWKPSWWWSG